jgi:ABC-type transporter Mla MlaB component
LLRSFFLRVAVGTAALVLLRVTPKTIDDIAELRIDGCITGDAANELWMECHKQSTAGKQLRLDLAGVTLVDDAAVMKLKRLVRRGAEIVNASLLVSGLLANEDITPEIRTKRTIL